MDRLRFPGSSSTKEITLDDVGVGGGKIEKRRHNLWLRYGKNQNDIFQACFVAVFVHRL